MCQVFLAKAMATVPLLNFFHSSDCLFKHKKYSGRFNHVETLLASSGIKRSLDDLIEGLSLLRRFDLEGLIQNAHKPWDLTVYYSNFLYLSSVRSVDSFEFTRQLGVMRKC